MRGSLELDRSQALRDLIIEHLKERAPTVNARRAGKLCQSHERDVTHEEVMEALEALVERREIELVRKGVYRLAEQPSVEPSAQPSVKPSAERAAAPLSDLERGLMRRYMGKRAPKGAQLSREDLESAQRVASYLAPYPAAPVDLEDVAAAEAALGLPRAREALWLHLKSEVDVVCELYKTPLRQPRDQRESAPVAAEPKQGGRRQEQRAEPELKRAPELEDSSARRERRGARDQASPSSAQPLHQRVFKALKSAEAPMSLQALLEQLKGSGPARRSLYELKRALVEANQEAERGGERPPFTFELTGAVGLSEWGVSSPMRASEARVMRELKTYKEQLFAALSQRLSALSKDELERLSVGLLGALGCAEIESLNAPGGDGVALMARHPEWGDCLALAQRTRKPLSVTKVREVSRSLSALRADRALLISLSGFAEELGEPPSNVQLISERDLLEMMVSHEVGVAQYAVSLPFVDAGFFYRLSEGQTLQQQAQAATGGE